MLITSYSLIRRNAKLFDAVKTFTHTGRLTRGRAYRGNINFYYSVTKEPTLTTHLSLMQISIQDCDKVVLSIVENAGSVCKLMMNEMPDDIEQPFKEVGLTLLPSSYRDFNMSCSCPDNRVPCKHIAGVLYRLAELLDQNPFLLFQLRGLSRKQLHSQLVKSDLGRALLQSLQQQLTPPYKAVILPGRKKCS